MSIKEKVKAFDSKVMNSKWTPRVLAGVGAVSAFVGNSVSAFADGETTTVATDTSTIASTLSNSAMEAVTNGYTAAVPVMAFALGVGIVIRKIMGAARHC